MTEFRVDDGPLRGWHAVHNTSGLPYRPLSQTVTAQPPIQPNSTLRISLSLAILPGDPQWEVMQTLGRQQQPTRDAREIRTLALGLLLPRVHQLLAIRGYGWQVERTPSVTPAVTGRRVGPTPLVTPTGSGWGPETTVRVSAADRSGRKDGARRLGTRLSSDGLDATFRWVWQQALRHPCLPPAASPVKWQRRTEQFLQTPLPGQPHPGQFVLTFTNAIGVGLERKIADSVQEAQHLAATHRPFNNTRTQVVEVVGVHNGLPVTEGIDLGPAAWPGPHRAAAAFPRPASAASPSTGGPIPPAATSGAAPTRPQGTRR